MSQHHDFFGTQLSEGDTVAFLSHSRGSSELLKGTVCGVTDCFVKVRRPNPSSIDPERTKVTLVSPVKVVRAAAHLQSKV